MSTSIIIPIAIVGGGYLAYSIYKKPPFQNIPSQGYTTPTARGPKYDTTRMPGKLRPSDKMSRIQDSKTGLWFPGMFGGSSVGPLYPSKTLEYPKNFPNLSKDASKPLYKYNSARVGTNNQMTPFKPKDLNSASLKEAKQYFDTPKRDDKKRHHRGRRKGFGRRFM